MIHAPIHSLKLLAAQQDSFRVWGRFDHAQPSAATGPFLTMVTIVLVLAAIALIWQRFTHRPARSFSSNSPRKLFGELCAAHRLSWSNRRLLKRLAAARNLSHPAVLFIEPAYWEIASLPAPLRDASGELQKLRAALFG